MGEPLRKRSDGLATIELVLEHARAELEASGPVRFNLDRVIESSDVARSSVYHHFGSRAGLIATIELEHWVESQASELRGMRKFLLEANDFDEVLGRSNSPCESTAIKLDTSGGFVACHRSWRPTASRLSPPRCRSSRFEERPTWLRHSACFVIGASLRLEET